MIESLRLIIGLFIPLLTGYAILSLILGKDFRSSYIERIALSFGIGLGFISLEMLLISSLKIPFSFWYIFLPCILLWLIALVKSKSFQRIRVELIASLKFLKDSTNIRSNIIMLTMGVVLGIFLKMVSLQQGRGVSFFDLRLLLIVIYSTIIYLAIWILYSLIISYPGNINIQRVLRDDATSYLPTVLLLFYAIQFIHGIVSLGRSLLFISILAILILKIRRVVAYGLPDRLRKVFLQREPLALWEKIVIGIIIFHLFYAFFMALITPLWYSDDFAFWGLKARIFYSERALPLSYFHDPISIHPDYPLLIPLSETWLYTCLGSWNDLLVKIIFPLYFSSLLAIFFCGLRRLYSRKYALIYTLLMSSIPLLLFHANKGFADLPLTYYCTVSTMFLFLLMVNNTSFKNFPAEELSEETKEVANRKYLIISAIFAGLAGWTKNEGLPLAMIITGILSLFLVFDFKGSIRKRLTYFVMYLLIVVAIMGPWQIFKELMNLQDTRFTLTNLQTIVDKWDRFPSIKAKFFEEILYSGRWGIAWFVFFLATIFHLKRTFLSPLIYIFTFVVLVTALYFTIHIITGLPTNPYLSSLGRVLLTPIPMVIFLIANQVHDTIFPSKQEMKREG